MTQFEKDLQCADLKVSKNMSIAIYNLIITKRDLTLWTKCAMKPTRSWSVTNVKKYFGISGSGQKLMDNFMKIHSIYIPKT